MSVSFWTTSSWSALDHRRKINLWLRWLSAQGIDPRTPSRADVLRYKQELQKQGKSVFTVNGYITVIKVFYKHCSTMRYYDDIVAVPDEVMASLEDYLSLRSDDFDMESPLFINLMKGREHSRILKPTISQIVKQRLRAIGIDDPKITAHSLRHTCGSLMVEEGMPIETIQDMLGHNDPATTQIYIDMARQKRLLEHSPSVVIAKIIMGKESKTAKH